MQPLAAAMYSTVSLSISFERGAEFAPCSFGRYPFGPVPLWAPTPLAPTLLGPYKLWPDSLKHVAPGTLWGAYVPRNPRYGVRVVDCFQQCPTPPITFCDFLALHTHTHTPSLMHPPSHSLSFPDQLLSALAYLHRSHIAHRDLKSANILITGEGCLKVSNQLKGGFKEIPFILARM